MGKKGWCFMMSLILACVLLVCTVLLVLLSISHRRLQREAIQTLLMVSEKEIARQEAWKASLKAWKASLKHARAADQMEKQVEVLTKQVEVLTKRISFLRENVQLQIQPLEDMVKLPGISMKGNARAVGAARALARTLLTDLQIQEAHDLTEQRKGDECLSKPDCTNPKS
jgi:hypothetical protein